VIRLDIASVASVLIALAALATACLTLRQQKINLIVIREERYFKEMDLLVKKLFQNRDRYELFEPHHVDPNDPEEEKRANEFWREIRENKYLAPKELRNIIEQYLKLVNQHKQNILRNRITLSDLLRKRCKELEVFKENISESKILNPIDTCIRDKLCPLLGEKGLVKPMPTDDRLKTVYLRTWQDPEGILYYLDINPQEELRGPAFSYFDAIYKPEIGGADCITGPRMDLSAATEKRYKELEEKIETIRADLDAKAKHWWQF
jgi:hypothetical protein